MAWADSPDGPWTRLDHPVITRGEKDDWDGGVIHDPYPLVYKGRPARPPQECIRSQGVAIADRRRALLSRRFCRQRRRKGNHLRSYIIRFDCALHRDVDRPFFKGSGQRYDEHTCLQAKTTLPDDLRKTLIAENATINRQTISG